MKPIRLPAIIDILIPILVIIPAAWALMPSGLPNTADGPVHFIRAAEMVHAWQDGILIPRWSANLGYGLGIPLFNYAPPLPYFLAALFFWLGTSLDMAMKLMLLTGLIIASTGAYRLGRDLLGVIPGAVSATAYVYAPIRLRELFVQGNAGQFMAWVFLPLACWGIIRVYQTGQRRYSLAIALGLAGTMLSHNAVALMLALMLALMTVVCLLTTKDIRHTIWVVLGGILGLGLAAWFWVPALLEGEYIQLFRIAASDFRSRFVSPTELIAWSPPIDTGTINPYIPLTLGVAQVFLALLGSTGLVIASIFPKLRFPSVSPLFYGVSIFFVLFSGFSAFMALAWSEPIWARLPFVEIFEFPSRWHGITAVGLAFLSGLVVSFLGRFGSQVEHTVGAFCILLLFSFALVNLYPQLLPPNLRGNSPADVVRWEVETGAVGTTSLGEFNPIWVTDGLAPSVVADDYLAGRSIKRIVPETLPAGGTGHTTESSTQAHAFAFDLPIEATISLHLHYFPGWQAKLNGTPIDIAPHRGSGIIDVTIPAGTQAVSLTFANTPLRRTANWLSALAWVGLLGAIGFGLISTLRTPKVGKPRSIVGGPSHFIASPLSIMVVGSTVVFALILRQTFPDQFRIASPPGQALPASTQFRADFSDQIRLLGVDLPPPIIDQGDTLTAVAYWQALDDLDTNYAVFLHLDTPSGETIASIDEAHPTEIPTSHWPPTLYHRNPLKLTIPADAPPIRYHLRVGLYHNKTGVPLTIIGTGQTAFEIGQIWVNAQTDTPSTDASPTQFGPAIRLTSSQVDTASETIRLTWQTDAKISETYSIFIHLLDDNGQVLGQVDGLPFDNQYPPSSWRVGQIINDVRSLAGIVDDLNQVHQIAIGVYDPSTGIRLEAVDSQGSIWPNGAVILSVVNP